MTGSESSAYAMGRRHDLALSAIRAHYEHRRQWPTVEALARRPYRVGPTWGGSRWRDVLEELVLAGRVERVLESAEERDRRVAWQRRHRRPVSHRRCARYVIVD